MGCRVDVSCLGLCRLNCAAACCTGLPINGRNPRYRILVSRSTSGLFDCCALHLFPTRTGYFELGNRHVTEPAGAARDPTAWSRQHS